jgi:hypothetical protein
MKVPVFLILLPFLTFQPISSTDGLAEKPQGPLFLAFSTDSSPAIGAVTEVSFTVTSRMDTPELTIRLDLPEDLPYLSGELVWTGPVSKNQPVTLPLRVGPLLERRSYEVIGLATIRLQSGSAWTQAASIILQPEAQEKPQSQLKHERQGQTILEIPVQ